VRPTAQRWYGDRLGVATTRVQQVEPSHRQTHAAFNIASYLHIETEKSPTRAFVRNSIEVSSMIGTFGLLFHFFRSLYEAKYVIAGLIIITSSYFALQEVLKAGKMAGRLNWTQFRKRSKRERADRNSTTSLDISSCKCAIPPKFVEPLKQKMSFTYSGSIGSADNPANTCSIMQMWSDVMFGKLPYCIVDPPPHRWRPGHEAFLAH
jgi:hypothetical protein